MVPKRLEPFGQDHAARQRLNGYERVQAKPLAGGLAARIGG